MQLHNLYHCRVAELYECLEEKNYDLVFKDKKLDRYGTSYEYIFGL